MFTKIPHQHFSDHKGRKFGESDWISNVLALIDFWHVQYFF